MLIDYSLHLHDTGKMLRDPPHPLYPVTKLERYETPSQMQGLGPDARMEARYAITLRLELVGVGRVSGNGNPVHDVYFEVLPKGSASLDGALLGFPTLDAEPFGLGHQC